MQHVWADIFFLIFPCFCLNLLPLILSNTSLYFFSMRYFDITPELGDTRSEAFICISLFCPVSFSNRSQKKPLNSSPCFSPLRRILDKPKILLYIINIFHLKSLLKCSKTRDYCPEFPPFEYKFCWYINRRLNKAPEIWQRSSSYHVTGIWTHKKRPRFGWTHPSRGRFQNFLSKLHDRITGLRIKIKQPPCRFQESVMVAVLFHGFLFSLCSGCIWSHQ